MLRRQMPAISSAETNLITKIEIALALLKKGKPETSSWYNRTIYYSRMLLALSYIAGVLAYLKMSNELPDASRIEEFNTKLATLKNNYEKTDFYDHPSGWRYCNSSYPLICGGAYPERCLPAAQAYCNFLPLNKAIHSLYATTMNLSTFAQISIAPALVVVYDSYQHLQKSYADDGKLYRYRLTGQELDEIKSIASEVKLGITNESSGEDVVRELRQRQSLLLDKPVESKGWMHRLFTCLGEKKKKEDCELTPLHVRIDLKELTVKRV